MEIKSKEVFITKIETLKPNPDNPNKHSKEQIDRLSKIIKHQGFRSPITVSNQTGMIVVGHGRLEAAKAIGMKEVPVIFQDFDDYDMEYQHMVADNTTHSDWAELDLAKINAKLEELGPFEIELLGFKNFEIEPADKFHADEDEIPEKVEAKTKLGDIYRLGDHRLMCGDSTSVIAVESLTNGEKMDMVYADPPYGLGYVGDFYQDSIKSTNGMKRNTNKFDQLKGDSGDWDFDPTPVLSQFEYCDEIFLWGADYYCWSLPKHGSWICWNKIGTSQMDNMPGASFELCWSKSKHKRHMVDIVWRGCFGHNRKNDGDKKVHPTQKPVKLAEFFFDKWGKDRLKVIDLFGGSGSTLIACEKTKRKCFMMELDPHYCDVIVARWEKFTGKKAELINR